MKIKFSALIIISSCLLLAACKKTPPIENDVSFYLSDTMMAHSQFAIATMSDVKDELKLFGKIEADNNKKAQVFSIVGGSVIKINVELGDYVRQGQVLATLRSSEVADFERQLLDAHADVALAEKNVQVARDLNVGKLNSEKEVIAAEKELEKAQAEEKRIEEVYKIYNLQDGSIYNITAPISGFVVSKNINQNEQLRSDQTDVLFSIAQIDEVWIMANVNESDISKVAVGYEADVQTISYPDKIFKGKVDRIFNAIDPETKAMKILVKIPNSDLALKPEMNVIVNLRFKENKQLIAIPSSSVIFDKSKNWVMVFKDRHNIETREVEVYRQLGDVTYVSTGLKDGEKVISKNNMLVYDALND
jgi:cobalt-zinc-cadmium efflux system membrane fusion protein